MEDKQIMHRGGELRGVAVRGARNKEKKAAHIMFRRGACTSRVVIYIHCRILPFSGEVVVMAQPLPSRFSPIYPDPVTLLRAWCVGCRTSFSQERRIVALLDLDHLERLPFPPCTVRQPGMSNWQWQKFLFWQHVQHILFWKGCRPEGSEERFSNNVNWLIRVVLFLAPSKPIHSDGEYAAGGEGGGPHKVPGAVTGFLCCARRRQDEQHKLQPCIGTRLPQA
jgi:hypothetical protein